MAITFRVLYRIALYGWFAFFLSRFIPMDQIVFLLVCGFSFLHDLLGVGKDLTSWEKFFFSFRIKKEGWRLKLELDHTPEWSDFGASFLGFIIGYTAYESFSSPGYFFFFPMGLFLIFVIFAILSRREEQRRS